MRLPIKQKQSAMQLSLPDLAGGLNMRDGLSEVLDNQLTDCENMWYKDGLLKNRAAIIQNNGRILLGATVEGSKPKIRQHNCYNTADGIKGQLCSVMYSGKIYFFWNFGNNVATIGSVPEAPASYFVCQYSNKLYCFTKTQNIYQIDISVSDSSWALVKESEMYIPTVMMQCSKSKSSKSTPAQVQSSGVMLEGYNILSDYYKMSFNSYNPEIVTEENPKHKMQYHILQRVDGGKSYLGKVVKAELSISGVTTTHSITISDANKDGSTWIEKTDAGDGLWMKVWQNLITFYTDKEMTTIAEIDHGGKDDIVITAPYVWSAKEKQKIFNMTRSEWFGGSSEGLSGGTRLFLCGNSKTENADLVMWSGLNNPLYFPENSYFYVGNETGAVTGFSKQSDKLIIFKENEIWYTQYSQNTNITASDLINQSVIDYASSSVYFPLTQINSNIGCAYPDTVELCRNRLVWLGGDKKVYTLVSESQYNERSIYSVSEMIERQIQGISKSDISTAVACDWDGYYCLLLGNEMLLMDYNCYGYSHIASYSKTEDANIRIPWYVWDIPKGESLMTAGDRLSLVGVGEASGYYNVASYHFENGQPRDRFLNDTWSDYEAFEITSSFTTKLFDFGLPHIRKNIEQLNLQLANNGGEAIKLYFITENGTEEALVFTDGTDTQSYTAGYITSRAVFPCIKQVLRFGLRFECKGALAVDSVILKYRTLGDAR